MTIEPGWTSGNENEAPTLFDAPEEFPNGDDLNSTDYPTTADDYTHPLNDGKEMC